MKPLLFLLTLGILLVGFVTLAQAQVGSGYDLSWWTVDGGSERLAGGDFVMLGTAGQPEAGNVLTGGQFTLSSGFWSSGGTTTAQHLIFLPLLMHN